MEKNIQYNTIIKQYYKILKYNTISYSMYSVLMYFNKWNDDDEDVK